MSTIKDSVKSAVIPEAKSQMDYESIAIVSESNESANVCTISYHDETGNLRQRADVPLRITNSDDWFPCAGEPVRITIRDGDPVITSRIVSNYMAEKEQFSCGQHNVSPKGATTGNTVM